MVYFHGGYWQRMDKREMSFIARPFVEAGHHFVNVNYTLAPQAKLDEIVAECRAATDAGHDVARLHSGDLSIWSALGEQVRRLDAMGIAWTVTPGVPSFAAAAAALGRELTLPEVAQSVVLTRTPGRASAMPEAERLAAFAATGATLAIHLLLTGCG
jgi:precorrin-4/cobalt-precorrin-4 C11-methyltransferase